MLALECSRNASTSQSSYLMILLHDLPPNILLGHYLKITLVRPSLCFPLLTSIQNCIHVHTCSWHYLFPFSCFIFLHTTYNHPVTMLLGKSRWQSRRTYTHLLQELQNYNSLLNNCWQENAGSHQKDTPCPRAKEKPQQDGRKGKIAFKIKSHTTRDTWRAQTYLVCTRTQRPHRDWARTVFESLKQR